MAAFSLSDWKEKAKQLARKAKQYALSMSDLEMKVEEATNSEPWGPHGQLLNEIAEYAHDSEGYKQILGILARRLADRGEKWRHVYKSLLVLEHLVKNGPYRICTELVNPDNMEIIENLRDSFDYIDARGRDHGLNVRHRAKELLALVQDKERLDMEREKASKLRSVATDAATSDGSFGFGSRGSFGAAAATSLRGGLDSRSRDLTHGMEDAVTSDSIGHGGLSGGTGATDAVRATQLRIEQIKAEGSSKGAEAAEAKKKLSDVSVDAKIAASFANIKLAPAAPKASQPQGAAPAPSDPAASLLDLDGGAAGGGAKADDAWDAFAGAAAETGASAADDQWAAFAEAPGVSGAAAPAQGTQAVGDADPFAAVAGAGGGTGGGDALLGVATDVGGGFGGFTSATAMGGGVTGAGLVGGHIAGGMGGAGGGMGMGMGMGQHMGGGAGMGVGMGQHVGGGGMGVGMGMGMGMSVGIGRNMGRGGMGMGAGMGQHGMSLGNAAGAPWSAGPMHAGGAGPVHSSPSAHAAAGARGPHGHGFMQAAGVSGGADADMFGDLLDMPRQGPAPKGPMRGIAESKGKGASGHHDGAGNGGSADLLGL